MKRLPSRRPSDQRLLDDLYCPKKRSSLPDFESAANVGGESSSPAMNVQDASHVAESSNVAVQPCPCDIGEEMAKVPGRSPRSFTDEEKLRFMRGHFTPDAKFSFPPREEKKKDRLS